MIEVKGRHNTAICFCEELEDTAHAQIKAVCDQVEFADSKIRIMPDVHAGMGCTIGTTMTITDKIVPGMVGVDIGCGMETVQIAERVLDCSRLDHVIHRDIPAGRSVRKDYHPLNDQIELTALRCRAHVQLDRARLSIGSLGGGNHFIEVDRADDGTLYVVVHSGSRHLGTEVAKYYQDQALLQLSGSSRAEIEAAVTKLKQAGRHKEIQATVKRLKAKGSRNLTLPRDLTYVSGDLFDDYLHDMKLIQRFAVLNRRAMMEVILRQLGLTRVDSFTTIHNYVDTEAMILRKGAISAEAGERMLIPINMRDGRLMSRKAAFNTLSLDEYRRQMEGIFTSSVSRNTLDEAPLAYKSMESIVRQIGPTAEIVQHIRPLYNFKASE